MTEIRQYFSGQRTYVFGWFLLALVTVFLMQVPVSQEPGAYETFYLAVEKFKDGGSPYGNYGYDLYKYSPTFLFVPLYLLSFLPLILGAITWQTLSLLVYYFGMRQLLQQFKQVVKPTALFSLLFIFYALSDLNINGTHGQSNTLLVGFMVLSLALYFRGQFVWAALSLAFVTNMKLFPIALTLLLFLDLKKRFISWTFIWHIVLALVPFVVWGSSVSHSLYSGWLGNLLIDEKISMGKYVHFYLSVRPFLEANFGIIWGKTYFIFVLLNAMLLALGVWRMKLQTGLRSSFGKSQLLLIFNVALLFMLVFNTRTEGPTLVLMAPIYVISLWWVFNHLTGRDRKAALWFIFFIFILVSQSTSDLFKGTIIQTYSWDHNLRALGIFLMYLVHVYLLFKLSGSKLLSGDSVYQNQPVVASGNKR